jgi:hypothetical protein
MAQRQHLTTAPLHATSAAVWRSATWTNRARWSRPSGSNTPAAGGADSAPSTLRDEHQKSVAPRVASHTSHPLIRGRRPRWSMAAPRTNELFAFRHRARRGQPRLSSGISTAKFGSRMTPHPTVQTESSTIPRRRVSEVRECPGGTVPRTGNQMARSHEPPSRRGILRPRSYADIRWRPWLSQRAFGRPPDRQLWKPRPVASAQHDLCTAHARARRRCVGARSARCAGASRCAGPRRHDARPPPRTPKTAR